MGLRDLCKIRSEEEFDNYWVSEGHKAFFVIIYLLLNVGLFFGWLGRFVPLVNVSAGLSGWIPIAKGCGMVLNFNCALVLIPVSRNLISFVRGTAVNNVVPMDKAIVFHRTVGYVTVVFGIIHSIAHWINYGVTNTGGKAFGSAAGLSGHLLLFAFLLLFVFALERVRISKFEWFYYVHHLFLVIYTMLLIHGPIFYWFFLVPGTVYAVERLIRFYRGSQPTVVLRTRWLPSNVIALEMYRPGFEYKSGQYIFINCPYLSLNEWHPFTITSSPDSDVLTLHIRIVGDWTGALAQLLNPTRKEDLVLNKSLGPDGTALIRIDGPFGTASEDAFKYPVSVLIGAGIGVTPFASILKSLRFRIRNNSGLGYVKRFYFFWVSRDAKAFEWFQDLLLELEEANLGHMLSINAYLTGNLKMDQIEVVVSEEKHQQVSSPSQLNLLQEQLAEAPMVPSAPPRKMPPPPPPKKPSVYSYSNATGYSNPSNYSNMSTSSASSAAESVVRAKPDVITGLHSQTHFGRPHWQRIFSDLEHEHPNEDIGVFFCGPHPLSKQLYKYCREHTHKQGTKFIYHKENF